MESINANTLRMDFFDPILLDDMDRVKLMNRIDRKYWFNLEDLQSILDTIGDQYYLLNIDGHSSMPYSTTYYDTEENYMFIDHHNGKLNRYKIRKRQYLVSGIGFLEVKFKSNKGRTSKRRMKTNLIINEFSTKEDLFIKMRTPYNTDALSVSLQNSFTRLTLVNKNFKERCTIDLDIKYEYKNNSVEMGNLVIVEIKSDGKQSSPLLIALRDHRIKASGFSKYCIGRTVTDSSLKRNSFKNKVRKIEKVINSSQTLYK